MNCLLERLTHMKSSRKLLVGKLREGEESNRRKSRRITHFEREEKESKVRYPFSRPDVKKALISGLTTPPIASYAPIAGSHCSCYHHRIDELNDSRGSRNHRQNHAGRRPKRKKIPVLFGRCDPPPASRHWTSASACAEDGMELCFV